MMIFGGLILLLIAISALAVVRTRNIVAQVLALTFYGLLLAVMFFVFQAPDVALSQIVVGAVALPLIVMLAQAKMQRRERRHGKEGA
ncbi:MAG TPA: hydrogenase subunit MbhD domain-containing protein [Terracidiphilus sp.]|nr:hydrogenase subunit MbhD domain-containing protein [Terracidiphilus sp.]